MEKEKKINPLTPLEEIRKRRGFEMLSKNLMDDLKYYKFCWEVESRESTSKSEEAAYETAKKYYSERYKSQGPITFEEVEKKYNEKLFEIGLKLGEERYTEIRQELIYIENHLKFANYLEEIKSGELGNSEMLFLDKILGYLINGISKYYNIAKSDVRLEELMLAANSIVREYGRIEKQGNPVFNDIEPFIDYVLAARGECLREFRFLKNIDFDSIKLKSIWDENFQKDAYIKKINKISKAIEKIQINTTLNINEPLEFLKDVIRDNIHFIGKQMFENPSNKDFKEIDEATSDILFKLEKLWK